ncbi:hypothetical protein D3C73_910110 [compost metagenome]
MVGGDAFAGIEVDVGKAQGQAIVLVLAIGLRVRTVAELDTLRLDVERAMAGAGTAVDHRARRLSSTIPDQVLGADGRHITDIAQAVNSRRYQYQVRQSAFARQRVQRIESDVADEVERVAGGQAQGFKGRRAKLGIAAQQTIQHVLVQNHSARKAVAHGRQCLGAAGIHRPDSKCQVTCAKAHRITEFKLVVGGRGDTAAGVKHCRVRAHAASACANPDTASTATRIGRRRCEHIGPAVGHHQQCSLTRLINQTRRRVIGHVAAPQGIDDRARFERDCS